MAEIGRLTFLSRHDFENKATKKTKQKNPICICVLWVFMDIFAIVNFGGEVFMFTWNFKKKKRQVAGLVLLASTSLLGLLSSFFCNVLREELTEKMKSIS